MTPRKRHRKERSHLLQVSTRTQSIAAKASTCFCGFTPWRAGSETCSSKVYASLITNGLSQNLILATVFLSLIEPGIYGTDFTLRKYIVSLIKWFSTVQQFLEKIVKCLGPLDQSGKCCWLWKMLHLNGSLIQRTISESLTCVDFRPTG